MYLASEKREVPPVTIAEVSNKFNVPRNHLVKVAGQLAKQGWVDAIRGRSGGLHLAVDPSLLKIGQVIRALEGRKELIDCELLECRLRSSCGLRYALNKSFEAFYSALDEFTLSEIISGSTGAQIVSMHKEFLMIYNKKSA